MTSECFYVEIRRYSDRKVVSRLGPFTERQMERVDDGANINLNHDNYYTMTVSNETGVFSDAEDATD